MLNALQRGMFKHVQVCEVYDNVTNSIRMQINVETSDFCCFRTFLSTSPSQSEWFSRPSHLNLSVSFFQ